MSAIDRSNVGIAIILSMLISALPTQVHAQNHDHLTFDPFKNPNRALAGYYARNQDEIKQLNVTAKDQAAGEAERIAALETLRGKYPDPAVSVAVGLINDRSAKIAALAAQIVSDAAVMMDHKQHSHAGLTAVGEFAMAKHELVYSALRAAVVDPREPVRKPAVELLAAQSDEVGLQRIAAAAEQGAYPALEAVNYLGLANTSECGKYLLKFTQAPDEDVQAAAVNYLSFAPQYKQLIRDQFLLNPEAKLKVRKAAAQGLASDSDLALLLLADPATPHELYVEVLNTYVDTQGAQLSRRELESLRRTVEKAHENAPELRLDKFKDKLDRLFESKTE